ncbi:CASP-like protein 5A2 [Linum perenne]
MSVSHASVHPVEDPSPTTEGGNNNNEDDNGNNAPARIRMKDIQGMPGTKGGLFLRVAQFFFSTAALLVMATTSDFPSVTAFWFDSDVYCISYLVAASGLQCLWSLSLAIVDIYALSVLRSLQNHQVVCLFAIGDGVTSTLTFAAACASAGITVLIDNDLDNCAQNHCIQFETATAMAFISWFTTLPSFLFNFWSLASR